MGYIALLLKRKEDISTTEQNGEIEGKLIEEKRNATQGEDSCSWNTKSEEAVCFETETATATATASKGGSALKITCGGQRHALHATDLVKLIAVCTQVGKPGFQSYVRSQKQSKAAGKRKCSNLISRLILCV